MGLRTRAQVAFRSGDRTIIQRAGDYFELAAVNDEAAFWTVSRLASGALSPEQISRLGGLPLDLVLSALDALRDGGLAYDMDPVPPTLVPSDEARRIVLGYAEMWRAHIFRDPMFHPQGASRLVWMGFLLENWHRAVALPAVLDRAIAVSDGPLRQAMTRMREEETGHERYYLQAAEALCADPAKLLAISMPLFETRSLLWFHDELAGRRPLSLLAVFRLTEAKAGDGVDFAAEAERLIHGYDVPPDAVLPLVEHGELDAGASHQEMIDVVLRGRSEWAVSELEALLQDLHDFRHAYGLFLSGIRKHYGDPTGSIPNRLFRWADFLR